jgi:hypothetical protein
MERLLRQSKWAPHFHSLRGITMNPRHCLSALVLLLATTTVSADELWVNAEGVIVRAGNDAWLKSGDNYIFLDIPGEDMHQFALALHNSTVYLEGRMEIRRSTTGLPVVTIRPSYMIRQRVGADFGGTARGFADTQRQQQQARQQRAQQGQQQRAQQQGQQEATPQQPVVPQQQ